MSNRSILLMNVKQVLIDLKSDRVNVRSQSLEQFHNILDNRSAELSALFRSNSNNDDAEESFTWSELFHGLHDAIKDQCIRLDTSRSQSQKSLMAKNDIYKEALRKCIDGANETVPNVPYTRICHAAFECFENNTIRHHFGGLYLQIVFRHILSAKHSISEIKISDWSCKFVIRLSLDQVYHIYHR